MTKHLVFSLGLAALLCSNAIAGSSIYGIYSNIDASQGEPSGFEFIILNDGRPGKCSDTVIFQVAEGWPQYPEMLDCCGCTADRIEFSSSKWGDFVGKVENNVLSGEFISARHKIRIPKGDSFWQKQ